MPIPPHNRRASRAAVAAFGAAGLIALVTAPAAFADVTAPGLVIGGVEPIKGVKPGSTFDLPVTVANKDTEAAEKVWVSYSVTRGLDFVDVPSNCRVQHIRSYDEMPENWTATCAFEQAVEPGVVYTPEKPLRVKALDRAYHDRLRVRVGLGGAPMEDENGDPSVAGTAPAVKLVEQPAGGEGSAERVEVSVTSVNTADYQVTGAALRGRVGDTVTMKVKFANAGPAWVLEGEEGERGVQVMITLPAGTSVVKRDYYCHAEGGTYRCPAHVGLHMAEDAQMVYTFKLKIDKRVAGAKGSIALTTGPRPFDLNKANDKADITLDVTGGGSTGSTGGSTNGSSGSAGGSSSSGSTGSSTSGSGGSGGGSSSTGGDGTTSNGGNLAETGSSTLPVMGTAAAAVATGAGTLLIVRRRRARRLS
uniref:Gram-positive cocci surface proteins LPxTG domain-containing protein n=1 Tax=Streptomyces sp. NBC_01393 TaxID=2903851 RepID=A0AAU3HPA1_9ACTN